MMKNHEFFARIPQIKKKILDEIAKLWMKTKSWIYDIRHANVIFSTQYEDEC